MIKVLGYEHMSWCVDDPQRPAEILALFGLKEAQTDPLPGLGVIATCYEGDNDVRFELIRPSNASSHLHKFLQTRGPGLHHVCFQVDNLEDACAQVKSAGGEIIGEVFADTRGRHAFVHPRSTGGVLIGMIELFPQFRKDK